LPDRAGAAATARASRRWPTRHRRRGSAISNAGEKERGQVNVRLDAELIRLLDAKRIALQLEIGTIPTRSDVVRIALEHYLKKGSGRK